MSDPQEQRAARAAGIAGAVLLFAAALGLVGAIRHVNAERERTLQEWQVRLGLVAESRAAAVAEWLDRQRGTLRELAENPSVQIYVTELALAGGDRSAVTAEPAQAEYLRNLLNATAERAGFAAPTPAAPPVANTRPPAEVGLAVVDGQGRTIAATPGMPMTEPRVQAALAEALAGRPALIDLHAVDGGARLGFAQPIAGIQGDPTAKPVGAAVGLRLAGQALARRLVQPGDTDRDAQTYMIRLADKTIDYLPALERSLDRGTAGLADAMLVDLRTGFVMGRDRDGQYVLATARPVAGTAWAVVRAVGREAALAETELRLRWTLAVMVGLILAVAAAIVAVWRHGTSVRAARAARESREAAERYARLSGFLRVVADAQPTQIAALDHTGTYRFANRAHAEAAGMAADDMPGKTPAAALGAARAAPLEALNREAQERAGHAGGVHRVAADGSERVLKSDHLPLPAEPPEPPGVLMVLEDITQLVAERERRERSQRDLVTTLVALVDRRDPFSSNHSARVADVARAIAEEMQLDPVTVETTTLAATLMNVGKMLVPAELLTKRTALSAAELAQVREAMLAGAELVRPVAFDGPVAETLRHLQERWDGSGAPEGLKGEAILLPARIVAVANTFVAMASPRAHRAGMALDGAARELMSHAGTQFDRRPVTALVNILENRGGRERWNWPAPLPA